MLVQYAPPRWLTNTPDRSMHEVVPPIARQRSVLNRGLADFETRRFLNEDGLLARADFRAFISPTTTPGT